MQASTCTHYEGLHVTAAERETGEAILQAATELFTERGYAGTTTRALAERAGVNEVTIFRRFKSKQGVLTALAASVNEASAGQAVESAPDPSDTCATLRTLARQEVRQTDRFGAMALRLTLEARSNPEVAAVVGSGPRQTFAGLAAYLAERQAAGDLRPDLAPQAMAEGFFALTSSFVYARQVLGYADLHELSVTAAGDQLFRLFWSGVAAGAAPREGDTT
jgi:AcrR family transcriptional regulator